MALIRENNASALDCSRWWHVNIVEWPAMPKDKVCLHFLSSFNISIFQWLLTPGIRLWWNIQLQSKHPNPYRAGNAARYKTLPSDWKTNDHYYFYGWVVTKEILQRYLSSINRKYAFNDDEIGIAGSTIFYMQRDVGFHHINYVIGKVDDEAAVNCRVEQTEEGPMLSLISIGCTRSKRLFWRRPTTK